MIIISTPEGDVELTGTEKDEFLASLPGDIELEPVSPILTIDKISSGLSALGFTEQQITAFISAVSK